MDPHPSFETRGVVLVPEDLTLPDWPERAQRAGLTTIALHHGSSPQAVARTLQSDVGQHFLERCRRLGLQVEYELHAMQELLPRDLFRHDPTLFRMNEHHERTPDANLCVHSPRALDVVGEHTVALAQALRPTTGRYFLWGDDGQPWCRCDRCRDLSDAEQALLLENHLCTVLRGHDATAQVAHLAYRNTLAAPTQVTPSPGVFLVHLIMKDYPNWLDWNEAWQYLFPDRITIDGRVVLWPADASQLYALSCLLLSVRPWNIGNGQPPSLLGWCVGGRSFSSWQLGTRTRLWHKRSASNARSCANGLDGFLQNAWLVSLTPLAVAPRAVFPPEVAIHVVRLACARPDLQGRSLSQWDCTELARQLVAEAIVEGISPATVRRILAAHQLKPWRHHVWLYPKQPRDAVFYATVGALINLYTRQLREDEMVLSIDEKTSLQPRPRRAPTRPAQPQNLPNRHEHEYQRAGALNLFAAFDTRSGRVYGQCYARKRQQECIAFLEYLDQEIAGHIRTIHLVCDNVSTHHGKEVTRWLAHHPRFVVHFTPVHCSWMNQVEQWFSILQRKRLRIADFTSKDHLRAKLEQFIGEWNQQAHAFNWSTKSVAKVMAETPALAA